jgi:hypothetical protein
VVEQGIPDPKVKGSNPATADTGREKETKKFEVFVFLNFILMKLLVCKLFLSVFLSVCLFLCVGWCFCMSLCIFGCGDSLSTDISSTDNSSTVTARRQG